MAKKQDNRQQSKPKPSKRYPKPGRTFNYLEGADREWAKENRFDVGERCVAVKDGKRFSGSDDTKLKCGDGRSGFSTRRNNLDDVSMEVGLDGQYKKKRSTLVKSKSARSTSSKKARRVDGSICSLASSVEIQLAMRDPQVVRAQKKLARIKGRKWRQLTRRQKRERRETIARLESQARGM